MSTTAALDLALRILHKPEVAAFLGKAFTEDDITQISQAYRRHDPEGHAKLVRALAISVDLAAPNADRTVVVVTAYCCQCEAKIVCAPGDLRRDTLERGPYCTACWEFVPDDMQPGSVVVADAIEGAGLGDSIWEKE